MGPTVCRSDCVLHSGQLRSGLLGHHRHFLVRPNRSLISRDTSFEGNWSMRRRCSETQEKYGSVRPGTVRSPPGGPGEFGAGEFGAGEFGAGEFGAGSIGRREDAAAKVVVQEGGEAEVTAAEGTAAAVTRYG